jgi:hypothetical protein
MDKNQRWLNGCLGLAAVGSSITGITSFLAALPRLYDGQWLAAAVMFVAAALSFGLLAVAVLGALRA